MRRKSSPEIRKAWRQLDRESAPASAFVDLSHQASQNSEPLLAYDIAREGIKQFPDHLRLRQIAALAQVRSGSPLRATRILQPVIADDHEDEDSYGILARAYKDLWERCGDPEQKARYGEKSEALYRRGHELTGGFYTGLNAAAMAVRLGRMEDARKMALDVLGLCQTELERNPDDYWARASFAEASLIAGDLEQAETAYRSTMESDSATPLELASTRRQALQLAECMGELERFSGLFSIPGVIVFRGGSQSSPGPCEPAWSGVREAQVKQAIDTQLELLNAAFGYCTVRDVADLLFIEAMLGRDAEINIVLPCHLDDVLERFTRKVGADWSKRLHHGMERAARLHFVTEERCLDDAVLNGMCDRVMAGLGRMRAAVLEVDPVLVTFPDRPEQRGSRAGEEQIQRWRRSGNPSVRLDISSPDETVSSNQDPGPETASAATDGSPSISAHPRVIRVMLFADMVGFSRLQEAQLPLFLEEYLQRLANLLRHTEHRPIARNTWGDGLFLVFDRVETGCRFALELRDLVRSIDWGKLGLPGSLAIRISLHAGPVYPIFDPVLEIDSFLGSHVSRAARIEPITTPGCVYASEQVAAILKSEENDLECEYVGEISLAKQYGLFPIYQIRREGEIE